MLAFFFFLGGEVSLLKKVSARGFYDYGVKTDRGYLTRGERGRVVVTAAER